MLQGGDLRLLCSAVVVVVLGWFVARRKLQRAAARREQIRRLMAFASEEAARVELEATTGYRINDSPLAPESVAIESVALVGSSPGRQLQYQCEVCFRPTATRCKQCKAVRYCSRKCQVFHWRQGHRDKCHFTTSQNINEGAHSLVKESELDGSTQNAEIEEMRTTRPVESSSGTSMFPDPILHLFDEKSDTETEASSNRKLTDINAKTPIHSLPAECSSSTISNEISVASDKNLKDCDRYNGQDTSMDVESMKPPLSGKPSLTNHEYGLAASSVSNCLKFDHINTAEKSESSTLSGCSAADSDEHSLSEPYKPSSNFSTGTVEPMRSKINILDEFDDVDLSNSRNSCRPSSSRLNIHVEMPGSGINSVMAVTDDPCPATSMPEKSVASEVSEDGLNSREPQSLSRKLPGQYGVNNTSTCSSTEEAKLSSCDSLLKCTSDGHVPSKPVHVNKLQFLAPKQLEGEIHRTDHVLDTLKCQQNGSSRLRSRESDSSSSSCTQKPAIQVVQSTENERARDNATCSVERSDYVQSATSGTSPSMRRVVDQLTTSNFVRYGSLGARSGITGRYEGSFPYELFVKLYNWNKVEFSPCGLINCGNSCYANSVLQCLAFTPPLAAYFLQGLHAKTCKVKQWCFNCEFEELVRKAKESNYPLSPARIMSQIQRMGSHLGNGREEDAHEFLRYTIDAMQSVCLKEAEVNGPSSLVEKTTLLGLTFGGYLQSKIECMSCGGKSKQDERIMDLTVEIGGEIGSLEDALLKFTDFEILDGENKYHCGRCESYEKAKKKLRVLEAPNVLVIALKRFQTGKFGKLNKVVKFPEILNLAPYMSGTSDKSPIYQLYGVVVHLDVMNAVFSGHYVCYIKNSQGRWFKADDSVVEAVDLEKVLSNDAYILFYARCSPRAPKVIRTSVGPCAPRKPKNLTGKVKSHQAEPWDVPVGGWSGHSSNRYIDRNPNVVEEESSSEYSSSFFSEAGSHSTESSNRESVSSATDDLLDQMLSDMGNSWNRPQRRSSGSGTPVLYTSQAQIADLERSYSSDAESSSSCSVNRSPNMDGDGFWAGVISNKVAVSANKESFSSRGCSSSSNSIRENVSNRLDSNKLL